MVCTLTKKQQNGLLLNSLDEAIKGYAIGNDAKGNQTERQLDRTREKVFSGNTSHSIPIDGTQTDIQVS